MAGCRGSTGGSTSSKYTRRSLRRQRTLFSALASLLGSSAAVSTWVARGDTPSPVLTSGPLQRRGFAQLLPLTALGELVRTEEAATAAGPSSAISEPLTYCGGGFCTFFSVGGRRFKGVVDTGSPFVLVSTCIENGAAGVGGCRSYCSTWGCGTPDEGQPSGLNDTDEVYAAGSAHVTWRKAPLGFGGAELGKLTYGVMLEVESYGGNGGGAFLGLIRDKAERIRPTLLGQTRLRSLTVDLRAPGRERLQLSPDPMRAPAGTSAIPLVDLRSSGAPVRFYAAEVSELLFAGEAVDVPCRVVAVLDTGTTGLELPPALFEYYDRLRRIRAGSIGLRAAQAVEVRLATKAGPPVSLQLKQGRMAEYGDTNFDIVTALPEPAGIDADAAALWAATDTGVENLEVREDPERAAGPGRKAGPQRERPLVIFLGLGFLLGRSLSIDTVANVANFEM